MECYEAQNNKDYFFFLSKMKKLFQTIQFANETPPLTLAKKKSSSEKEENIMAKRITDNEFEKVKERKRIMSKDIEDQKREISKRLNERRTSCRSVFGNSSGKKLKTLPNLDESIEYEGDFGAGKAFCSKIKRIDQVNQKFNDNILKFKNLLENNPSNFSRSFILESPFVEKIISKLNREREKEIDAINNEN